MTEDSDTRGWARAHDILDAVLELPDDQREAYIVEACSDDAGVAARVREWLAGIASAAEDPASVLGGFRHAAGDLSASLPDRIGRYRVVRLAGAGGMGTVYEGVRDDGTFRQRVAIKVLRPIMAARADLEQRFRVEREILASLSHPNIAAIHDGGVTPAGLPYCILEYVDGQAITTWCDARRCTVRERIALVRQVCQALRHAHGRLVVHGDIKPTNVLVSDDGTIKLLDFGLARLLDAAAERGTPPVGAMTPEYASPEQLRGEALTVASDVYSLAATLQEVLTGSRPDAQARGWQAIHAAVHAGEAAPASRSALTLEIAEARATSPPALRRQLQGDLDAILARALARDPRRRYHSIDDLDADLGRMLRREPVAARNGGTRDRIRKFVMRSPWVVGSAAVAAAALLAWLVTAQRRAADAARAAAVVRSERNAAVDLSGLLLGFLELAWPWDSGGTPRTLRPLLDSARTRLLSDPDQLGSRYPHLLESLATGYLGLGDFERALDVERRRLAIMESRTSSRDTLGRVRMRVADMLRLAGHLEAALAMNAAAMRDLGPTQPDALMRLRLIQARTLRRLGRADEARMVLDTLMQALASDSLTTRLTQASAWEVRAELALDASKLDEAATAFQRSLALRIAARAPQLEIGNGYGDLARIALRRADIRAADTLVGRALTVKTAAVGRSHPEVADEIGTLAMVELARGNRARAVRLMDEALAVYASVNRGDRMAQLTPIRDSLRRVARTSGSRQTPAR